MNKTLNAFNKEKKEKLETQIKIMADRENLYTGVILEVGNILIKNLKIYHPFPNIQYIKHGNLIIKFVTPYKKVIIKVDLDKNHENDYYTNVKLENHLYKNIDEETYLLKEFALFDRVNKFLN